MLIDLNSSLLMSRVHVLRWQGKKTLELEVGITNQPITILTGNINNKKVQTFDGKIILYMFNVGKRNY
jgi:hypothetical protein